MSAIQHNMLKFLFLTIAWLLVGQSNAAEPQINRAIYRKPHQREKTNIRDAAYRYSSNRYRRVPRYLLSPNYRFARYGAYSSVYRPWYSYRYAPWYSYTYRSYYSSPRYYHPYSYYSSHYAGYYYGGYPYYGYGYYPYAPHYSFAPYAYGPNLPYIAGEPIVGQPIISEQNNYEGCYHW